jgi:hypothetical protein
VQLPTLLSSCVADNTAQELTRQAKNRAGKPLGFWTEFFGHRNSRAFGPGTTIGTSIWMTPSLPLFPSVFTE